MSVPASHDNQPAFAPDHVSHSSSMELIIESAFLSELLQEMWFIRGQIVEVLHSTVDAFGYDVVLQCGQTMRHVQLKAKKRSGATRKFALSTLLTTYPAACVICVEWSLNQSADRMDLTYRWLGNGPTEPLDDLGGKISKNSRGKSKGFKGERAAMRDVALSRFTKNDTISDIATRLFGNPPAVV